MKTILLPTDFSLGSNHAAEYGYWLASQLKARIILCNAVGIPEMFPQNEDFVWQSDPAEELVKSSSEELSSLKIHLEKSGESLKYKPVIDCVAEEGTVREVLEYVVKTKHIDLIVLGTHFTHGFSQYTLRNNSKMMIHHATKPILLVPPSVQKLNIKRIVFAVDLKYPGDVDVLKLIIPMAMSLNAELILTHFYSEKNHQSRLEHSIYKFMENAVGKYNYAKLVFKLIKGIDLEQALDKLCKEDSIDLLSMIHRPHNFVDSLFNGSHTNKMADHINIPLLVFKHE